MSFNGVLKGQYLHSILLYISLQLIPSFVPSLQSVDRKMGWMGPRQVESQEEERSEAVGEGAEEEASTTIGND